jgi:hypothetical protein
MMEIWSQMTFFYCMRLSIPIGRWSIKTPNLLFKGSFKVPVGCWKGGFYPPEWSEMQIAFHIINMCQRFLVPEFDTHLDMRWTEKGSVSKAIVWLTMLLTEGNALSFEIAHRSS